MSNPKTRKTGGSVTAFLAVIKDPDKQRDCRRLGAIFAVATGRRARMCGASMVGYGQYDYRYAIGHEGSWFEVGYAPRARNLTVYIMPGFSPYAALMNKLGRFKTGSPVSISSDSTISTLISLSRSSTCRLRRCGNDTRLVAAARGKSNVRHH